MTNKAIDEHPGTIVGELKKAEVEKMMTPSAMFESGTFECYKIAARRVVAEHVSAKRQLNSRSPIC
jgi:hypothetical protein